MSKVKEVMIIGAGIGGLVTALQLHRLGISAKCFETVKEIRELGVGINLLPHSVRILTDLGLAEELEKEGVRTAELNYYNKFGQKIWHEPRGIEAGYKWPQYSIHRGRLQMILLRAVQERLGKNAVQTGFHLSSFEVKEKEVVAHFIDKKTGNEVGSYASEMMIGADGIHSVVRRTYYPNEGPPIYGGRVLWRGTTYSKSFLTGRSMIMAGHSNTKFVAYPISNSNSEGKALINWIAELSVPGDLPRRSDWNRKVQKEDFAPAFANWHFDWLNVPQLIEDAEEVFEFPLVDRNPLPKWSFNRVTLLGDAAHPMYPIGSNGASQAILDSDAMYLALLENESINEALTHYEKERLNKTASIILSNRQNGPEIVMQMVEDRAPNGFIDLYSVISQEELENVAKKYKQVAGFERETLNSSYGDTKVKTTKG